MEKTPRIAIIGAGVNGVGCALAILKAYPQLQVTIYSDQFTPYTTGDGAAGFWSPYIAPGTPSESMNKWSKATWDLLETWYNENKYGVDLMQTRKIDIEELSFPDWSHIAINYRDMSQEELKEFGSKYVCGHSYSAYIAEPMRFLPPLMHTVMSLGGKFERRNVQHLEDLSDKADIIINCSGIGARDLVPDSSVYPVRGQLMKIHAPWVNKVTFDMNEESFAYIIPTSSAIGLGGTHQENDWRTTVDMNDSRKIWKNCTKLVPELKKGELISEWVGLRPARKGGIRVEEDSISVDGRRIPIVHNYGHGGCGITTFWGCALDVKDFVGKIVNRYHAPFYSKL